MDCKSRLLGLIVTLLTGVLLTFSPAWAEDDTEEKFTAIGSEERV